MYLFKWRPKGKVASVGKAFGVCPWPFGYSFENGTEVFLWAHGEQRRSILCPALIWSLWIKWYIVSIPNMLDLWPCQAAILKKCSLSSQLSLIFRMDGKYEDTTVCLNILRCIWSHALVCNRWQFDRHLLWGVQRAVPLFYFQPLIHWPVAWTSVYGQSPWALTFLFTLQHWWDIRSLSCWVNTPGGSLAYSWVTLASLFLQGLLVVSWSPSWCCLRSGTLPHLQRLCLPVLPQREALDRTLFW